MFTNFIVSLNWILNNDHDQIEKLMLEIEDYLDLMENNKETNKTEVVLGDDNPGFEESKEKEESKETEFVVGDVTSKDVKQQQEDKGSTQFNSRNLQSCPDENISVTVDKAKTDDNRTLFNFFNIKMIFIGSAVLMFSQLCGN